VALWVCRPQAVNELISSEGMAEIEVVVIG